MSHKKEYFPAGSMIIPWASISRAAEKAKAINPNDLILGSLWIELYAAAALAETYGKIWHSIIWIRSKIGTKRRVAATLNRLAFSINEHLEGAKELFNEFCDSQSAENVNPASMPKEFWDLKVSITLAQKGLKEFHNCEIESCQLHLWEKF